MLYILRVVTEGYQSLGCCSSSTKLWLFWKCLSFKNKMPNGFRFWFNLRKGKRYWIWLNKITTCVLCPLSDRVEMAIACLYDISYPRTTAKSNGTRCPWWDPNRCYPFKGNWLRIQSRPTGDSSSKGSHTKLLNVKLTCRWNCSCPYALCECVVCGEEWVVWEVFPSAMLRHSGLVGRLESTITFSLDNMMTSNCILWSGTYSPLLPLFWFSFPW